MNVERESIGSEVDADAQSPSSTAGRVEMTHWLVAKPAPFSAGARDVERIEYTVPERPLLHACCNKDTFGDCRVDIDYHVRPTIVCDVRKLLPFRDDSFAASIADVPWTAAFKTDVANVVKELLRVAPIAYILSPWTYGASWLKQPTAWIAWTPGVNQTLTFIRYERKSSPPASRPKPESKESE